MVYTGRTIILAISIFMILVVSTGCLSSAPRNGSTNMKPNVTNSPITTTEQIMPTEPQQIPIDSPSTTNVPIPTIPTECVMPANGAGTYIHTISDTNQNLPDILIWVTPIAAQCSIIGPKYSNITNATGWTYIGSLPANYEFNVSLIYAEKNYNISIPQEPLYKTYATFKLPSGNLSIIECTNTTGQELCKPYNDK